VLAVLKLEQVTGRGAGQVLGFEAGELAGFEQIFFRAEHPGGMARTAVHAAFARSFAFALAVAFPLAVAVAIAGQQFVGPIVALALALAVFHRFLVFF